MEGTYRKGNLLHHHDVAGVDLAAPLRRRPAGSNESREVGRQSLCVLEIAAVHELVVHMRKPVRVARKPHVRDGLTASHAIADLDRDGAFLKVREEAALTVAVID